MTKLSDIEGIGDAYAAKLADCGCASQARLLEMGGTAKGRQALAEGTGISATLISKWVNRADLARVKGIGGEYADLLECAGVDTVPELAQRNPANLHAKLAEVNEEKKLVRALPSEKQVADWVVQAKGMERAVHY